MSSTSLSDERRRKFIVSNIPAFVRACWQAKAFLSPTSLLDSLVKTDEPHATILGDQNVIQSILGDVKTLDLSWEGKDVIRFDLSRWMLLDIVCEYVRTQFTKQDSSVSIRILSQGDAERSDYDAELKTCDKNVYVKLSLEDPGDAALAKRLESAELLGVSEYWLFTLGNSESDIRLAPAFVSENKILFGRLRRLRIARVLREYLGEPYEVLVKPMAMGVRVVLSRESFVDS